ncbi:carbohydrate-binding domain-containing protein [Demequina flava]|uniref:carbohydrate-binding domain-containing protein n=1 Tax=Demequina flava TaxID=1095025 RepID=UPI000781B7D2|nr:carbohydrate-binding domain-containing protein [Demequina flava]
MKKRTTQIFAGLTLGALLMTGCSAAISADDEAAAAAVAVEEAVDPAATGTGESADDTTESADVEQIATEDRVEADYADLDIEEVDLDYSTVGATEITLADGASTVDGSGATVDGDTVTITESGTYVLSGELSAGQVVVNGDGADVVLVLDGVDITAEDVAGINVVDADWVVLGLEDGTTNTVSDSADAVDDDSREENAAIYSTSDLWITGSGSLEVNGVAADGITSKDTLVIDSGSVDVTATDDGLRGKDHLVVLEGDVTVNAGGDGLKSDNVLDSDDSAYPVGVVWITDGVIDITAGTDAIDAENQVTIEGGSLTIAAGDDGITTNGIMRVTDGEIVVTESFEGFEAAIMHLDGGTGDITAEDDGMQVGDGSVSEINDTESTMPGEGTDEGFPGGTDQRGGRPGDDTTAPDATTAGDTAPDASSEGTTVQASYTTTATDSEVAIDEAALRPGDEVLDGVLLDITGGTWTINSTSDGLDSNGNISMTGGTVVIAGPTTDREGALDYNGSFSMDGGTIVAAGASGMAQAPDAGDQAVIGIMFGQTVTAGSSIAIVDAEGDLVASYTADKDAASIVFSSADVVAGDTYTVIYDGDVTGTATAGLVTDGSVTGGTEAGTVAAE